jgi:outer membrane protein
MKYQALGLLALMAIASAAHGQAQPAASTPAAPAPQANPPQATPGQTPPIQPKTPAVVLPPQVAISPPPAGVVPSDVPNRPLTASEAAQIALRRQPSITIAAANVQAAQGRSQQTASGLYPSIGLSASNGRTDTFVSPSGNSSSGGTSGGTTGGTGGGTTGSSGGGRSSRGGGGNGYNTSINLNQLLFDFNHTRDLVRASQANERAAQQGLTRAQSDLVLQVKQAFYAYSQNSRLVGVNESSVASRQSELDLAQARLNAGLGPPADVVRARTNLADAVSALIQARAQALISRITLAQIMGVDPRTPIVPSDSAEPAEPDADTNALTAIALRDRPDVKQAQENLRAAGFALSAARTANAPTIGLSVGLNANGPRNPLETQSLSAGLNVAWNFFDAGLTAGRIREARANETSARATLEQVTLSVVTDVTTAYVQLKSAEQRLVTADSQVQNALESLRLAEGRYRAGFATFIEVIDAQTALVTAQTNQVNARSTVDQARAALNRAIGRF